MTLPTRGGAQGPFPLKIVTERVNTRVCSGPPLSKGPIAVEKKGGAPSSAGRERGLRGEQRPPGRFGGAPQIDVRVKPAGARYCAAPGSLCGDDPSCRFKRLRLRLGTLIWTHGKFNPPGQNTDQRSTATNCWGLPEASKKKKRKKSLLNQKAGENSKHNKANKTAV